MKPSKSNPDIVSKPAISVRNVTKEFVIPHERRTTLFENLKGMFSPSTYEKFTALKDVSLTVEKGESVGIIGDNGSGKSTLLKIISQILRPTSGSVEINGRITPFLELGVGFQPDMTAKENIEVYSTIMGLSSREISKNMDSVLEFAGLTRFRDTKLKNFSSGMYVRLAFATAIQTKPDILLVDEVLAVGDMDFQQKCLDTFNRYKAEGITMVFVSHDLNAVRKFCDKTLLLKNGVQIAYGDTGSVIDTYVYRNTETPPEPQPREASGNKAPSPNPVVNTKNSRWGNRKVEIPRISFIDKYGNSNEMFISGDPLTIRIHYTVHEEVEGLIFGLIIYNEADIYCYGTTTKFKDFTPNDRKGNHVLDLKIDRMPMFDGRYFITVAVVSPTQEAYDYQDRIYSFVVKNPTQDLGLFDVYANWSEPEQKS